MIKDLKDLKKMLRICRDEGVVEMECLGIKFKLGDLPPEQRPVQQDGETDSPYSNFPDGILTPEQLMFYSAGGDPKDDPALKGEQ